MNVGEWIRGSACKYIGFAQTNWWGSTVVVVVANYVHRLLLLVRCVLKHIRPFVVCLRYAYHWANLLAFFCPLLPCHLVQCHRFLIHHHRYIIICAFRCVNQFKFRLKFNKYSVAFMCVCVCVLDIRCTVDDNDDEFELSNSNLSLAYALTLSNMMAKQYNIYILSYRIPAYYFALWCQAW